MNVDNSDTNQNRVTSKYFLKEPMDESLSDFQETKKSFTGPKISKANTKKPRKAPKRPKGQRDIRTALKSKKNDLISYTEKFYTICKQSGIDVDTEELQLAIALSKSLQIETSDVDNNKTQVCTQERITKIRTTLQEYGFNVPETKLTNKKKVKRLRKDYKLISKTDTEKEQIISDKYSQVLFANVDLLNISGKNLEVSDIPLFYISTNISYKDIKNIDVYYIDSLVEKSSSNGCLLRDWEKIPGRPASPKHLTKTEMNFSEIECSQEELDSILSGPFKCIKKIINLKEKSQTDPNEGIESEGKDKFHNNRENRGIQKETKLSKEKTIYVNKETIYRSRSPDIFEDEESVVEIITTHTTVQDKNYDAMDLTKCINNIPLNNQHNTFASSSCSFSLSQKNITDVTKRKSNDFMEITECIASSSKPVCVNVVSTHVTEDREIVMVEGNDTLDLTQSSDSGDDLPEVHLGNSRNLDDTVVLNINDYEGISMKGFNATSKGHSDVVYDLTQEYAIKPDQNNDGVLNKSQQDCFNSNKDIIKIIENNSTNIPTKIGLIKDPKETSESDIYLTQSSNTSDKTLTIDQANTDTIIDDEYIIKEDECNLDVTASSPSPSKNVISDHSKVSAGKRNNKDTSQEDSVDLTQSSNSSVAMLDGVYENYSRLELSPDNSNDSIKTQIFNTENDKYEGRGNPQNRHSSLGKKDNISIDYDEVCVIDGVNERHTKDTACTSHIYELKDGLNSTQGFVPFEIVDNELEYSLHKSKRENFNFGGISVLDDLPNNPSFSNSGVLTIDSNLDRNSSLPLVELENNGNEKDGGTPVKNNKTNNAVETPKNNDYIIQLDDVTPMPNYAAMSSPERMKELHKYGLKPFKRKRAIQLLTHIYNQTHPLIESCSEDLQSPSKKFKRNVTPPNSSRSKSLVSPKKGLEMFETNENIYEVTNYVPEMKEIVCQVEDWVFQKREKAKIHSCRVPLHIAFHNYVSCRRGLRESILRYEPVNIDVIHKQLVAEGHRYDPKELLKFMDKKCITVKTDDNNTKNHKY